MLGTLITSKTRIKLLLKFFLNANNTGYLKNLEAEFEESSNGIRLELNKFEDAGLLTSENIGNKKVFRANKKHPLFNDIHSIILKYSGVDQIIESVVNRLGNVNSVYLVGSFARGLEVPIIDIIIVGDIDKSYLNQLIDKTQPLLKKEIRYILYGKSEFESKKDEILPPEHFLIWDLK